LKAIRAVFTGELPVVEKRVLQVVNFRRGNIANKKEASRGRLTTTSSAWTDKIPHPPVMEHLDEINTDPDVDSAITMMTETIASGFYTEMGEGVPKKFDVNQKEIPHPNKVKLDKWNEAHRADENIKMAVRESMEKGFFAIDCDPDSDYDLKVLPSSTMYCWRKPDSKKPYKFTQEIGGTVVDTWAGSDLDRIIWWAYKETPSNPYGKALAFCLEDFVDARQEMTDDGNAVLHRLGYPDRRFEAQSKDLMDKVFKEYTTKRPEETIFLDGLQEGDLREIVQDVKNVRVNFEGFQQSNDTRIANGLNVPSISYLRNATEASATKMLDFFSDYCQGIQFSLKRVFENSLFAKVAGQPVPSLVWGRKKTGLEKLSGTDVASLFNGGSGCITFDQAQDLLKKLGLPLKDLPQGQPTSNPLSPSLKDLPQLDPSRVATLKTSLEVIEKNYRVKNIDLEEAFKQGSQVIKVHVTAARQETLAKLKETNKDIMALSPEAENFFRILQLQFSSRFREKLLPHGAHEVAANDGKRSYTVTVNN
jgi:hypothetical protein